MEYENVDGVIFQIEEIRTEVDLESLRKQLVELQEAKDNYNKMADANIESLTTKIGELEAL